MKTTKPAWRGVAPLFLLLALGCTAHRMKSSDSASAAPLKDSPIDVYVYLAENHDPAVGATVFVLGSNDCVLVSTIADGNGVAHFPPALDRQNAKYVIAELKTEFNVMMLTGVRWSIGRREYNLPLRAQPMVNRATVFAP
jgi:hypothetical protein